MALRVTPEVDFRLGAKEYYIYDPQQEMQPPFLGYERRDGRLEPMAPLPGGGIASPLLGAELRPVGAYLRVIDPATGEPLREPDEERRDRLLAEGWARVAEQRAAEEAEARMEAEERARWAEDALRDALAELARRPRSEADENPE